MKKRIKFIVPLAVLSVGCAVMGACSAVDYTYSDYTYRNPDFSGEPLEKDEGVVLDGKADEAFWKSEDRNWLMLNKATDEQVSLRTTSYIGEKGLYMLFDVDDPSVYVNPDRATYNNSGIELYISASTNSVNNAYEIDLVPDGRSRITLNTAKGNIVWAERFEFGVSMKGGEYNTSECKGYVIEAFFPNRMFGEEKRDMFYSDIAVISTVNETSTDREWYPFALKEYGGAWLDPVSWFKFDTNGYMGGKSVGLSQSSAHVTLTSHPMAVANFSYQARLEAEEGYAITGLSVNGVPADPDRFTEADGGVGYRVKSVREDIELSVTTEKIAAGNKTLSGKIYLHQNGEIIPVSDAQVALKNVSGANVPVSVDGNGAFSLSDLPQGLYTFTVSKEGCKTLVRNIDVNRNRNIKLLLEAPSLFAENANWDVTDENDGVVTLKYGNGAVLQMENAQDDFVFGYTVKPSEEELKSNIDLRYGIRASFQASEGSLAGKYFAYDLLRKAGSEEWVIQIPNHGGRCIVTNWPEPYKLTALQKDALLNGGLQVQLVRQGKTFYLYVNGIKADTREFEGAENVKATPGLLYFGNAYAVDFGFEYSTEYDAAEWDTVTVQVDGNVANGTVSFDKTSYTANDTAVITATPDNGYMLVDILVNGYSYASEIAEDNTLTIPVDAKTLNVKPIFVDASTQVERKTVYFPDAEGLQVRLMKDGAPIENSEKTVANGKAEFTQVTVGRYVIQVKAFGIWSDTDKVLTVIGSGTDATIRIENAAVYTSGNWTTVQNTKAPQEVSVGGLSIEDGWFVTKISNLTDIDGEIRFGFKIDYEGATGRDYTILKQSGSWKFQILSDWKEGTLHGDFELWVADGKDFYFAVHRTKANGAVDVYMGTGVDRLIKVGSPDAMHAGKNIVRFGLKREKGAFDVTFSEARYGATVQEAFGFASDAEISVNNHAPESAIAQNHGAITVNGSKVGGAVTLSIRTDTSDPSKRYTCTSVKVNGAERLQDFIKGTLALSQMYLLDTLQIEATFEEAQKFTYSGTARFFKENEWHDFDGFTLVFTNSEGTATEVPVGAGGAFSAVLYSDSYLVTLKDRGEYVFETAEIELNKEQTGVKLNAACRVFDLTNTYGYDQVIAQNTFVDKTVNGETMRFDGSLALNDEHKLMSFANYGETDLAGNFSLGVYVKAEDNYTSSSNDRRFLRFGIGFSDGTTLIMSLGLLKNTYKLQVTDSDNPAVAAWAGEIDLGVSAGSILQRGAYLQLVREGNVYYWVFDGIVYRTDTITKTPAKLQLYRGWNWDIRLTEFAYKVGNFEGFKEGTQFNTKSGVIAENVTGDFEAQITVKSNNIGNYRGGFALNFGGKSINIDLTNAYNSTTKSDLQANGGISNGWKGLASSTDSEENGFHNAVKGAGCTFKIKRVTTAEGCSIELTVNGATLYTMKYDADCFTSGAITADEFAGAVTVSLRSDNNVTVKYGSFERK